MQAGKLRHRVTFQHRDLVLYDEGNRSGNWDDVCTVWARIEPFGGREYQDDKKVVSEATHRITTRYLPESISLTSPAYTTDRIVFAPSGVPRYFHIESIINVEERNIEYIFICRETT